MRSTGKVVRWQAERGFGFIAPDSGAPELFVHVSAIAGGGTPRVGEAVSYEVETGPDGRKRAVRVERTIMPRRAAVERRPARERTKTRTRSVLPMLLMVSVLGGGAWLWSASRPSVAPSTPVSRPASAVPAVSVPARRCDGRRHCSQMTSCEEARWFLQHCPGVQMDGNHDGEPCEQQWCR